MSDVSQTTHKGTKSLNITMFTLMRFKLLILLILLMECSCFGLLFTEMALCLRSVKQASCPFIFTSSLSLSPSLSLFTYGASRLKFRPHYIFTISPANQVFLVTFYSATKLIHIVATAKRANVIVLDTIRYSNLNRDLRPFNQHQAQHRPCNRPLRRLHHIRHPPKVTCQL